MDDYLGMYVKKFESGTAGSLCLCSSGYDWGLSCGSYQLTLRWGNCINFLRKYFPTEASGLYYNGPDVSSKSWPGVDYSSSPDGVKAIWQRCYNKVGAQKFFEYEHEWIQKMYYDSVKAKIKNLLDLDALDDRAYKELFWSWAVHKGPGGAYTKFKQLLADNKIDKIDKVDKEFLFDAIYDLRYLEAKTNRYKKGLPAGMSERETLRPLLKTGVFFPNTPVEETKVVEEVKEVAKEETKVEPVVVKINDLSGILKVIYQGNDGVNVRPEPNFTCTPVTVYKYGVICNVVGISDDEKFYKLDNGYFITTGTSYVKFSKPVTVESTTKIRILINGVPYYKEPDENSKKNGTVDMNQVFTIVDKSNGFGKLKSGAGWIKLDSRFVKEY